MLDDPDNSMLVNIVMVAYNQQDFIGKAIESVLSQKTTFKFRLILGDDCSTDNTYQICKKYAEKHPDLIYLFKNPNNLGLIRNYLKCFSLCTAEYIAILEGDDYWTDTLKLEKQINLMLGDSQIGLVHTNYKIFNEDLKILTDSPRIAFNRSVKFIGSNKYPDLIKYSWICAGTAVFRKKVLDHIDFTPFILNGVNTVDLIIWLQCCLLYKIDYISEITTIYRVSSGSISNNKNFEKIEKFTETKYFIRRYFLKKYSLEDFKVDKIDKGKNVFLLYKALRARNKPAIKKYFKKFTLEGCIICIKQKLYGYN